MIYHTIPFPSDPGYSTPIILPSDVCPNPKLPVEVADGVALHCRRVTNLPSLSKEGVVMEGDHGGYFNCQVTRLTGSALTPQVSSHAVHPIE